MKTLSLVALMAISAHAHAGTRFFYSKEIPVTVKLRTPTGVEVEAKETGVLRFANDASYCKFEISDKTLDCQVFEETFGTAEEHLKRKLIPLNYDKNRFKAGGPGHIVYRLNVKEIFKSIVANPLPILERITTLSKDGQYLFGDRSKYKYHIDAYSKVRKSNYATTLFGIELLTNSPDQVYDFTIDMGKKIEEVE